MKKVAKKVTLQTLDKKIDGLGASLDKKIDGIADTVGTLSSTVGTLTDTVDSLARSTKLGFDNMVSKTEFTEFKKEMTDFKEDMTDFSKKTGSTLFGLDSHARTTNERLGVIEKSLPPLEHLSQALKVEVQNLNLRMRKVEMTK